MAVWLVFVDLDRNRLRLMPVRMAVIVAMLAIRAMHVGSRCRRRGMGVPAIVCMRMTTSAIGATFGFKGFVNLVDNQVHGAQHVGQHMVGFYL